MDPEESIQPGLSKRQFLKVTGGGALAGTGLTSAAAGQENGRPTVTVEETGCKQLTTTYTSGRVPLSITLDGPSSQSFGLGPAMVVKRTVDPGTYTVRARPAKGAEQSGKGVRINGSPVTVEDCRVVRTRAFCSTHNGDPVVTIEFTNTTDEVAVIQILDYSGENQITAYSTGVRPGQSHRFSQYTEWFSRNDLTHRTFTARAESTGDPIQVEPAQINFPGDLPCLSY